MNYQGGGCAEAEKQITRKKILNDKMTVAQFYDFLKAVMDNLIIFTEGGFYICMSSSELYNLWKAFTDAGGHWQAYVIWVKQRFTLSRTDYQQQMEPILYGLSTAQAEKAESEDETDADSPS